ncbi:Serine/threonine-protein kinase 17A [Perkinsus olseni]|uniref:Serine/threonine-protein kinase 17A n=1 Tax=Perkinsus olseni TaxID=32597 RepID=A0A7J6L7I3_PEROL|nr:Serine/threonine-protein kinase 17A [Perkinsus olseni]
MGLLCSKDIFDIRERRRDSSLLGDCGAADIRDHYLLGDKIGEGAYGQVRKCHCVETGELYAVKILPVERPDKSYDMVRAVVANEVSVLEKLNHPNVCKPREFFEDEYFYYQVMQMYGPPVLVGLNSRFAPNVRYRNGTQPLIAVRLPEYRIADLIKSALKACAYIHSQRIVHRDIKGDNFLFESADVERGELVMVDFGLAVELQDDETLKKACGTVRWVAPEMLQEGYNSGSVDVWAVGVLLYILVYGCYPYDGTVVHNVLHSIVYEEPAYVPVAPDWEPSSATKKFVKKMISKNWRRRPSASQALDDTWFLEMAKAKPTILTVAERKAKAIKRAAARIKIAERSTTDRISNQDHQPVIVSSSERPAASSPSAGVGELSGRGDEDFISGEGPSWSVDGSAGMGAEVPSSPKAPTDEGKEEVAAEEPPKADQGQSASSKRAPVSPSLFVTAAPSVGQRTEVTPVDPLKFISLLPSTAERHRHHHRQLADDKDSTRGPKVEGLLRSVSVALKNDLDDDDDDDASDVCEGEDGRGSKTKGGSLTRVIPAHFSGSRPAKDQLRQESKDYQVKADNILDKLNTEHMHGVKRGNRIADFVLNRSALAPGPNKNPLGNNRFISFPPNANTSSTTEMSRERAMMMDFRSVLPGEVPPSAEAAETQMQKRLSLEGLEGRVGLVTNDQHWRPSIEEKRQRGVRRRQRLAAGSEQAEVSQRFRIVNLGHPEAPLLFRVVTSPRKMRSRPVSRESKVDACRIQISSSLQDSPALTRPSSVPLRSSDAGNTRLDRENRVLQRQLDQQRRRVEDMSDVLRYSREERQRLEHQSKCVRLDGRRSRLRKVFAAVISSWDTLRDGRQYGYGLVRSTVRMREADAALDESQSMLDGNNAMKEMLAKELDSCRRDLHAVCLGVIEVGCLVPSCGGGMGKPGDSTQDLSKALIVSLRLVILDRARAELLRLNESLHKRPLSHPASVVGKVALSRDL